MNEELQKWILESLRESKDLLITQAPDVVQQFLAAQALEYEAIITASVLGLILGSCLLFVSYRHTKEEDYYSLFESNPVYFTSACLGIFFLVVGTFCSIGNGIELLKLKQTPKGYLLERVLRR